MQLEEKKAAASFQKDKGSAVLLFTLWKDNRGDHFVPSCPWGEKKSPK